MTLREIANIICDSVGREYDTLLTERVMRLIVLQYNTLIKESVAKTPNNISSYNVTFTIDSLSKVDKSLSSVIEDGKFVLRSTNKIPKPIVINGKAPFHYVGTSNMMNPFTFGKQAIVKYSKSIRTIKDIVYYDWIDDYIYIYNTKLLKSFTIQHPFEVKINQDVESNLILGIEFDDDTEFPAPSSIINTIILIIKDKYLITEEKDRYASTINDKD